MDICNTICNCICWNWNNFVSFLPGDSLLFVVGALSAGGHLNLIFSIIILIIAVILGVTVDYHIGKFIDPKIFNKDDSKLFNKKYLIVAHDFYEKYGGKTIILARFNQLSEHLLLLLQELGICLIKDSYHTI